MFRLLQVSIRRQQLVPDTSTSEWSDVSVRVRLHDRDLRLVLQQAVLMVRDFFPSRVLTRMTKEERLRFWDTRQLRQDDWLGLASLLLSEYFSRNILTPLQETDTYFSLKVTHISLKLPPEKYLSSFFQVEKWHLGKYLDMSFNSDWKDDLDLAQLYLSPSGDAKNRRILLRQPNVSVEAFNPLSSSGVHSDWVEEPRRSLFSPLAWTGDSGAYGDVKKQWLVMGPKRRVSFNSWHPLADPLMLPHPVEVAIIIHSRTAGEKPPQTGAIQPSRASLDALVNLLR